MKQFRAKTVIRTYVGPAKHHYSDYRDDLIRDFNGHCAYTDCSHAWWAGGFHIDHFVPKNPKITDPAIKAGFQAREHSYNNLVYACPQINRAKSNDWVSEDPNIAVVGDNGYFHPSEDFNLYFERTDAGGILPKDNPVARYMWKKLKLYLKRYELYWRLEQIAFRQEELLSLRKRLSLPLELETEVYRSIAELTEEYIKYFRYLEIDYNAITR